MLIYIIRHGETDLNAKGILQGWLDELLNGNGRKLAKVLMIACYVCGLEGT